MTTDGRTLMVAGQRVSVVRKRIKNLHLGVYPPDGRVRVAAPLALSDEAIRVAVVSRLGWIKRQQSGFVGQPRESTREMVSGESHYFRGRRYRLAVVVGSPSGVSLRSQRTMELRVLPGWSASRREQRLREWYREHLRELVPGILAKWQGVLGVSVSAWGIRRMKTKWGSCNAGARRILLNVELAKKPVACLEYVMVHELAHLIDRRHSERFVRVLDEHLPHWRQLRKELGAGVLAAENWMI